MNHKDDKESGYVSAVESISVMFWHCHDSEGIKMQLLLANTLDRKVPLAYATRPTPAMHGVNF